MCNRSQQPLCFDTIIVELEAVTVTRQTIIDLMTISDYRGTARRSVWRGLPGQEAERTLCYVEGTAGGSLWPL